jgi:pilus assembly protein CpaF
VNAPETATSIEPANISPFQVINYGPLSELIDDASVTEILVNGFDQVWFERGGVLHPHTEAFANLVAYHNFLQRLFGEIRRKVDLETPQTDGEWRGFRVHAIQPPLSAGGAHLSLRRRSPQNWRLDDLAQRNWCTPSQLQTLRQKILQKKSFLIVGATGSGKTAVLNACLKEIPENERVVSIEDTDEIHLPNCSSVKLLTREYVTNELKPYSQTDLLKQSLRMRPDRIVVGEVRGAEAKDFLLALSTGHGGALATLHASTARQALLRLEMLVQMGAPEWRVETVRSLIHLGLDSIVVLKKEKGERVLEGIYQLASLEETGFCLEKLT